MTKHFAFLGIAMTVLMGTAISTYASTANVERPATKPHAIVVAQSSPQQAQCQQEAAQLQAQLAQCTTDGCRQSVQAAIVAHNQRCQ